MKENSEKTSHDGWLNDTLFSLGDTLGEYITSIPPSKSHRQTARETSGRASGEPLGTDSYHEIKAPIPGVITAIFIKEGEFVKSDQPMMRLEAMKMENEILARSSGKVLKLNVKPVARVGKNEVLAVIKT